jgi:AAA family ATP:ADP antiporter
MLGQLLRVRRGESGRAALLFAYLFLVITSYVVIKATRDAMFLERFSAARLPFADIAAAVTVGFVMALYIRVSRFVALPVLLAGTLTLFAGSSLMFWAASRTAGPFWLWPALYIWAGIFGVLLPAQVWTLANYVLTTREAKRLFGIVGSGAITGWIVGGWVTRMAARRFGTESLLLATAVALAICPVLVVAIWRGRQLGIDAGETVPQFNQKTYPRGLRDSLRLVWSSPHLRAIAGVICLSSIATTVAAWQFRAMAKHFIPQTDALTAFFGTFNFYAGTLSLLTQLLLTSRLLSRFGLGTALLVVPCALTAGSLGVLIWGSLAAAVLLKGSDQVLRYSIDRSSVELLYLPVPARQTFHAKAFIDTVVWRVGDCLGALTVLAGVAWLGLSASQISLVTLILIAGWIMAARTAERQYVVNLRNSIYQHRVDAERMSAILDRSTTTVLEDALGAHDPDDILYALSLLERDQSGAWRQPLRDLLTHPSPAVRKKAIAMSSAALDHTVLPRVEQLLGDPDLEVRTEALLYLTHLTRVDPLERVGTLDTVRDFSMHSAVLAFLARPGPAQNLEAARALLAAALRPGPETERIRLEVARLIRSVPDQLDDQLRVLVNDPVDEVAREAIRSVGAARKQRLLSCLVQRLNDRNVGAEAADALAGFGEDAVPALNAALASESESIAVRREIPDVLVRIGSPSAERALVDNLLNSDPLLRLRIVAALNKLRQLNPERRLQRELVETVLAAEILGHYRSYQVLGRLSADPRDLVACELQHSMSGEVERIFRLLKLLFPQTDLHSAYFGLQSANAVVHDNALEFLEHTLPQPLRGVLLPLIDKEVSVNERVKIAERLVGTKVESSEQALAVLNAGDEMLRDAARKAKLRLDD